MRTSCRTTDPVQRALYHPSRVGHNFSDFSRRPVSALPSVTLKTVSPSPLFSAAWHLTSDAASAHRGATPDETIFCFSVLAAESLRNSGFSGAAAEKQNAFKA